MPANSQGYVTLSSSKKRDIASLAEFIFGEYQVDGRIDPVRIIEAKHITLNYGRYENAFDGMLEHLSGRFHIYCNLDRVGDKHSPRARFTLCHELGHFFNDDHRNALAAGAAPAHPSASEYESDLLVEQEADCFAANLLMPEILFRGKANSFGLGLAAICALAKAFGTSVTSTAIRYASLGLSGCVVIKWNAERVAWRWYSDVSRNAGFRKVIDQRTAVVDGSATALAFSGVPVPEKGYHESVTTAAYWFPTVDLGGWKDGLLKEHAISLGRFGVLTILFPIGAWPGSL